MEFGRKLKITMAQAAESLARHQRQVPRVRLYVLGARIDADRSIAESKLLMAAADAAMAVRRRSHDCRLASLKHSQQHHFGLKRNDLDLTAAHRPQRLAGALLCRSATTNGSGSHRQHGERRKPSQRRP